MAKIYGDRWEIVRPLRRGGQAEVFLVRDLSGENDGELVLKRVLNSQRHARFRSEVQAIKNLDHPNIIRLIDHSALSDDDAAPEKQFIVMPLATNGDLSDRVALYKDNPDSVVQVAKSLARGLNAAHAAEIVHRDVKPQNILFSTAGHDVWLADFGICLIREAYRHTDDAEVVGPARFMAPELESGGKLNVTPAADIYSLGKVIYFMLSGGIVLPRERLHEPEYANLFVDKGERQRLLETLLARMVCDLPTRLQSMNEVLIHLERIECWERDARLLPIAPKTLTAIEALQRKAVDVQRKKDENASVRSRRLASLSAAQSGTLDWFRAELQKTAPLVDDGHGLSTGVRDVTADDNDSPMLNNFRPGEAVELWLRNIHETFQREHVLRFSFCTQFKITGRTYVGGIPSMPDVPAEPEDTSVAIVPTYGQMFLGSASRRGPSWQFFAADGRLYRPPAGLPGKQSARGPRGTLPHQQQQPVALQLIGFSTADWPEAAASFSESFQRIADVFFQAVTNGSGTLG